MSDATDVRWVEEGVLGAARAIAALAGDSEGVQRVGMVSAAMAGALKAGGKIMAIGNGGSMCDAMHFAEELTGRFRKDRPALGAMACSDPSHLTCVGNDYGFENVFSRWVEGLGRGGDVLVVLSTSGNSENVLRAVMSGRERGMVTVGLLGKDGGKLRGMCEHEWIAAGEQSDRIQEVHMLILHLLVEGIERVMWPELWK